MTKTFTAFMEDILSEKDYDAKNDKIEIMMNSLLMHKHKLLENVECGVWIGCGWVPLIDKMTTEIQQVLDEHPDVQFSFAQIKQKFGELRIYADMNDATGTKKIQEIIGRAEDEADVTCETCGQPGTLRNNGYIFVACEKHK